MQKKIFIETEDVRTRLALVEDGEVVEYYQERPGRAKLAGNIYVGRVENVLPGMQAAFVDIGLDKNAFLHLGDIQVSRSEFGEELEKRLSAASVRRLLRRGREITVQVIKEPGGAKGPRVSSHITLPGRYAVLLPGVEYVGVSRKIEDEGARERLRALAEECRPAGMGLIVRTAAKDAPEEAIREDAAQLADTWKKISVRAQHSTAPALIHQDEDLVRRSVRDMLSPEVSEIWVNNQAQYEQLRALCEDRADIVCMHENPTPLFAFFGLDSKLEKACARRVWLKCGGYLVIDHTEALTVIDVNTGKFVGAQSLDDTVLRTNCEAAGEIVRQLRLRDVGGIVIVDFIDMTRKEDQQRLLGCLREELKKDRTKTNLVGLTELGLVELTRKKLRQPLYTLTRRTCPRCQGLGTIPSEEELALSALHQLRVKAAHLNAGCWLITASQAVAGQLLLLDPPEGLTVYVCAQSGRLDENVQIDAMEPEQLPAKAKRMTTSKEKE